MAFSIGVKYTKGTTVLYKSSQSQGLIGVARVLILNVHTDDDLVPSNFPTGEKSSKCDRIYVMCQLQLQCTYIYIILPSYICISFIYAHTHDMYISFYPIIIL